MKEYELVHEIKNSCPNNQMRDIFFDEIECENPESWLRQKLAGRNAERRRRDDLCAGGRHDGKICLHTHLIRRTS